ncbi:type II secretion system F family protein [Thalassococcus sp. BH17M4-6]|uniref:type II secretion system F family protein n=1 Tax=Thalassococcus sp. BH17M4-6 TaxID=3413148 RepID=UPI003BCEB069
MAAFLYRAIDPKGRRSKGLLDASSEAAARAALRQRNLLPIAVEPTRGSALTGGASRDLTLGRQRLPLKRLALVTRQLSTLIGSDVRIEDALKIVADQSTASGAASLLLNLRSAILDGRSFAAALDDYPGTFGQYYRASVRAGESAGRMASVMEHLAQHIEDQSRNRQSLQLALIYPALLALVSLGVIVALLTFVVPDIVRVFTSRGAELPWLTKGLITLSDLVTRYGLAALTVLALAGVLTTLALRRPAVRLGWHRFLLRAAPTRGIVRKINAAQFSGTLATLVQSGVPLAEALRAASDTVPNLAFRARATALTARVNDGAALSKAVEEAGILPPMLVAMIASGEAGGTLGRSLERGAQDLARDLRTMVATIVALVEPAVLLIMGGIVMLLVLAILMPIVGLNSLAG